MAAAAVDETLPTIDFPNHPQKKKRGGGKARNEMEGPTSQKTK
jgi:hypothetical protein